MPYSRKLVDKLATTVELIAIAMRPAVSNNLSEIRVQLEKLPSEISDDKLDSLLDLMIDTTLSIAEIMESFNPKSLESHASLFFDAFWLIKVIEQEIIQLGN